MVETRMWNHSTKISVLIHAPIPVFARGALLSFLPNGQIWLQNKTTTAIMAPSWITTSNIL